MIDAYHAQVRLLLDVLPLVAEEPTFALKGGTAINVFERDLPRLSVDIDLTYLPVDTRAEALVAISKALQRIKLRIERTVPHTRVTLVAQDRGLEAKLHCQRGRTQIKIEVNPTLRGHLLPTRLMTCTSQVQETFEAFVEIPVISHGELFGGKICAALDRQHPRDLFDVYLLLNEEGLVEEIKFGFLIALISHRRPISELLSPTPKDQRNAFSGQFAGMTSADFTYSDHQATLTRLIETVRTSLSDRDKAFLLGFKAGAPDWALFPWADVDRLPAVQWKLENLKALQRSDNLRHSAALATLTRVLEG